MSNIFPERNEITILVHGPIMPETETVLDNIRKIFENCPIILSTWKNSDLTNLSYDILVESDDPGAEYFNIPKDKINQKNSEGLVEFELNGKKYCNLPKKNNVNRMIVSVQEGLKEVKTKYVLKLRSDLILKSDKFLEYWDKYPCYNNKYKIFKHRIINDSTFAQFAHVMKKGIQLLPFHMSDWLHFGLTEDIKLLFSCPLHDNNDAAQYWYMNNRVRKQFDPFLDAGWQYPPETHILHSLVKKYYPEVNFKDSDDYNKTNMSISNLVMANNFIFLDQDILDFKMDKYPYIFDWEADLYDGFITTREWHNLYKTYCDKNFKFCDIDKKRIPYYLKLLNIGFLFKYPGKYIRSIKRAANIFNKKKLRKAFYIGVVND